MHTSERKNTSLVRYCCLRNNEKIKSEDHLCLEYPLKFLITVMLLKKVSGIIFEHGTVDQKAYGCH